MPILLAFLLGLIVPQFLPLRLSPFGVAAVVVLWVSVGGIWRSHMRYFWSVVGGLLGVLWCSAHIEWHWRTQLPTEWELKPITVTGRVRGLPQDTEWGRRFLFEVETVDEVDGKPVAIGRVPSRLALHDGRVDARLRWEAGSRWRARVRLKRVHGEWNLAGLDYETRQIAQGIGAQGSAKAIQRLEPSFTPLAWVDRWRSLGVERVYRVLGEARYAGLIAALSLGDQSRITAQQWQLFQHTGVIHLISISGVHLTLAAAWVAWLTAFFLRRVTGIQWAHRPIIAAVSASFASFYAVLAGFSVPTQRSLFMIVVLAWALGRREPMSMLKAWMIAAVVVLGLDPWASLTLGFWLSFGTVGVMMWVAGGFVGRQVSRWRAVLWAQWGAFWATLLPVVWGFNTVAWVSPLANAYAIPVIGGVCTALILCAVVVPVDAGLLLAHSVLSVALWPVEMLGQQSLWWLPTPNIWAWVCAWVGTGLWLLPRQTGLWWPSAVLFLPLVWGTSERPEQGAAHVRILDVGQGLAVHIMTRQHDVLYDVGAAMRGSDAGRRVVMPVLRALGVTQVSSMVLSHDDNDHVGGAPTVYAQMPVAQVWTPDPQRLRFSASVVRACRAGEFWEWDGVEFAFLYPYRAPEGDDDNAFSCVLRVRTGTQALLLTGDIPVSAERELVQTAAPWLRSHILVAAHHGSRTSSSESFLQAVAPEHVIVSAGYRNRYRHPSAEVWSRFGVHARFRWRTDRDGALTVRLTPKESKVTAERAQRRRYWFDKEAGSGR